MIPQCMVKVGRTGLSYPTDIHTSFELVPDAHYTAVSECIFRPYYESVSSDPTHPMYSDPNNVTTFFNDLLRCDEIIKPHKKQELQIASIKLNDFDLEVPSWLIRKQITSMYKYFNFGSPNEQAKWKNFIENIATCHIHPKLIMPDGHVFKKSQGLISGSKEYKYLQVRLTYFFMQYCLALQQLESEMARAPPLIHAMIVKETSALILCSDLDLEKMKADLKSLFEVSVDMTLTPYGDTSKIVPNWSTSLEKINFVGYNCFGGLFELDILTILKRLLLPQDNAVPEDLKEKFLTRRKTADDKEKIKFNVLPITIYRQRIDETCSFQQRFEDQHEIVADPKTFECENFFNIIDLKEKRFTLQKIDGVIRDLERNSDKARQKDNCYLEDFGRLRVWVRLLNLGFLD